jgi:hypothetical protein
MSDLACITPEVRTLARPASVRLLAVRFELQRSPSLKALFIQAKAEAWAVEKLVDVILPGLEVTLEGTPEELRQAALYLADEYFQIGDALLIVSRDTGRAIARITEADIWEPSKQRREDGSLIKALPRLRPELEGFLIQWVFDQSHEAQVKADLAKRSTNTAFLAQEGDPKLRVVTRTGRLEIVQQIRERAPEILGSLRGLTKDFLDAFEIKTSEGAYVGSLIPRSVAFCRTQMNIADQRAINLSFDVPTQQRSAIGSSWVREILRTIALSHPYMKSLEYTSITESDLEGAHLWAGNHSAVSVVKFPGKSILYIESERAVGFKPGKVGTLVLHPETYNVRSREVVNRWEVAASVEFTVWVDWSRVVGRIITNPPFQAKVIE